MSLVEQVRGDQVDTLPKRLRMLYEILKRKGIDLADLEAASVRKVGFWQAMHRDDAGEAVVTDLARIELAPSWDDGPAWPPVQPATPPKCPAKAKRPKSKGWQTCVVLPDMQMGYFHNLDGELEAIHDEAAIAISVAICADENPDVIVLLGDNADFCELGKYRTSPAYAQTTQATIDRCALLAVELRTACPTAEIVWLEGNHEARLPNYLLDNAKSAFGLRRGLDPKGWPVLSMPFLCHFDDAGVDYRAGYPAGEHWLNDNVRFIHGHLVDSKGSTSHKYLDDARVSTIFGHIHRRELAQRTRHTRNGPRTVSAMSFGCLCRLDGVVPSTKGGLDLYGRPVATSENWQQGLGVLRFQPGDGLHVVEHVEILNGWAMHRGQEYRA
jgi:hypothetical protein